MHTLWKIRDKKRQRRNPRGKIWAFMLRWKKISWHVLRPKIEKGRQKGKPKGELGMPTVVGRATRNRKAKCITQT